MDLIEYEPTEIIKISVGDLSAPVQTGVELSKLAAITKNILVELLQDIERIDGKLHIPPETLPWIRELRAMLKDINDLTKGVQEKVALKQMDIVGELYKKIVKDMKNEDVIKLIRNLND